MSAREHFEFPRSPFTQVPKSALKHVSSERLNELSVHKERREYHIRTSRHMHLLVHQGIGCHRSPLFS